MVPAQSKMTACSGAKSTAEPVAAAAQLALKVADGVKVVACVVAEMVAFMAKLLKNKEEGKQGEGCAAACRVRMHGGAVRAVRGQRQGGGGGHGGQRSAEKVRDRVRPAGG